VEYDDIIIGSGLVALGAYLGLPKGNNVLVIADQAKGDWLQYDHFNSVPKAFEGMGGLGNAWHGVIPLNTSQYFDYSQQDLQDFLAMFYTDFRIEGLSGYKDLFFVPWFPIRPTNFWRKELESKPSKLFIANEKAERIDRGGTSQSVTTGQNTYRGKRIWSATGTLHSPKILASSIGVKCVRDFVSDHVISYLGQITVEDNPDLKGKFHLINKSGLITQFYADRASTALYSVRPAMFDFRELDYGLMQRAAFGLPTGGLIKKLLKRVSPGMLVEAVYNKTGLMDRSDLKSVYAQIDVKDAYRFNHESLVLEPNSENINARLKETRDGVPFHNVLHSKVRNNFLPGIHIHHSVDESELRLEGINCGDSPIQVLGPSIMDDIGNEHHSVRCMILAHKKVREAYS